MGPVQIKPPSQVSVILFAEQVPPIKSLQSVSRLIPSKSESQSVVLLYVNWRGVTFARRKESRSKPLSDCGKLLSLKNSNDSISSIFSITLKSSTHPYV